jgi:putative membrane protein
MKNESRRYTALAAVAVMLLTLGACNERSRDGGTSGAVDRPSPGDTAPVGAADAAGSGLTDPNIVALLDEANMADSAAGAYALTKATNPEVKSFAKLMMGEHHALRAQGQQLAKQLNVTPQPPANDPVKPLAESEMAALRAAPKGAQFDRTYIDQEVAAHKAVLDLAKKAHDEADNEELKKLIEQAQPIIEKHLEMAEDLQKKLGGPSA